MEERRAARLAGPRLAGRSRRELCLGLALLPLALAGCATARASSEQPVPTEGRRAENRRTEGKAPTPSPTRPSATPRPTPTPSATPAPPAPRLMPLSASELARSVPDLANLPSPLRLPPERILIPRVGIDSKIVRLDTKLDERGDAVWETAAFAVGHHRGSANPGERGNIILSGHISSVREGAVFKRLPEVVKGDGVILITAEQNYLYRVTELAVVTPDHLDAVKPTPDETLTLITCVPDGVYSHRLIVTAKRVQPSPTRPPVSSSS